MRRLPVTTLLVLACAFAPAGHAKPPAARSSSPVYAARFDSLWAVFDREYSYFEYKHVDWQALRDRYRPRAIAARSDAAFRAVLVRMLAALRDVHVSLVPPGGAPTPAYVPGATVNWSRPLWSAIVAANGWTQLRPDLGRAVIGGVPYVCIGSWNPASFSAADLDSAIAPFRGAAGLIVDVRPNAGGNDALAIAFAGRFATAPVDVEYVRYREGPSHTDFGPEIVRTLEPRGPWTFTAPVVVLAGRGMFSSAETFVSAMRELPNVTVLGDTTGGSSGNPALHALGDGWSYTVPRWIARTADRRVIEWNGIPPDVVVPWDAARVARGADPVLDAAIARLHGAPAGP